jgi:hypothetical protein
VSEVLGFAHRLSLKHSKVSEVVFVSVFKWNMKFVRGLILAL